MEIQHALSTSICEHSFESRQNTRNRPLSLSPLLSNKYLCVRGMFWSMQHAKDFFILPLFCGTWGAQCSDYEDPYLQGCDTMWSGTYLLMIWRNVLPASSGKVSVEEWYGHTQRKYWDWYHFPMLGYPPTLNLEAACLSETPAMIYETSRSHIMEERSLAIVFLVLIWDWRNIPSTLAENNVMLESLWNLLNLFFFLLSESLELYSTFNFILLCNILFFFL